MQLALSFTTLLASVLYILSATSGSVEAAPAKRSRSVTLPLTRIHQNRDDVHPQIVSRPVQYRACGASPDPRATTAPAAAH